MDNLFQETLAALSIVVFIGSMLVLTSISPAIL
jgi:hypothetical protein